MASLDDGPMKGTASATGAVGAAIAASATGFATGVTGAGAGSTGAAGAIATSNAANAMGATFDDGAALLADNDGVAGAGTATVLASTGACSACAPGYTGTSTATAAMVGTTNSGTTRTTGTAIKEDPDDTLASISLPTPKGKMTKELYKNPNHYQLRLASQLHTFLLQDSTNLTQLNDVEKKLVVGIINIPKSSTIRVLHSFGVGTNPIGGSFTIVINIISLVGDGSSANPP